MFNCRSPRGLKECVIVSQGATGHTQTVCNSATATSHKTLIMAAHSGIGSLSSPPRRGSNFDLMMARWWSNMGSFSDRSPPKKRPLKRGLFYGGERGRRMPFPQTLEYQRFVSFVPPCTKHNCTMFMSQPKHGSTSNKFSRLADETTRLCSGSSATIINCFCPSPFLPA